MQRVASILPSWDRTKTGSKKGFDKVWGWADKLGAPVNRLTNKIGSEAFWPTSLDKESDKAARILRSFCKDGFYSSADRSLGNLEGPAANTKQRVLKKIPKEIIQNCVGLAIFTTMRSGLWISGAGGSGVLIARQENGEWSPPSGILLHTAGLGFLVGVDIYDCVVVINNRKALESFTKLRATLGGEISAVAGPVGVGGVLENDGKWKQLNRPVFTYLKSRGFYAGVQFDGTVIIERSDENERFYGERISTSDIIAGRARHPPFADYKMLLETVKAAEGRVDVDKGMLEELEGQPAPGDVNVDQPSRPYEPAFGIPEPDDPDPFGVLALEKAGFEIREAGTKARPDSSQFEYKPSPTSPMYAVFKRMSVDTTTTRSNRGSMTSNQTGRTSIDRATQITENGTTTTSDERSYSSPMTSPSIGAAQRNSIGFSKEQSSRALVLKPEYINVQPGDLSPYAQQDDSSAEFNSSGTTAHSMDEHDDDKLSMHSHDAGDEKSDDDLDSDEEEPVVFEVASVATNAQRPSIAHSVIGKVNSNGSAVTARGSLVTIAKRLPPALPKRSPMRDGKVTQAGDTGSICSVRTALSGDATESVNSRTASPMRDSYEEVAINGAAEPLNPEFRERSPLRRTSTIDDEEDTQEEPNPWTASIEQMEQEIEMERRTSPAGHTNRIVLLNKEARTHSLDNDGDDDEFHDVATTPGDARRIAA